MAKDKNEIFILPEHICKQNPTYNIEKIAVVAYLYYEDTVERYLEYLDRIPEWIDIYVISSNRKIFEQIQQYANLQSNRFFIEKENRGRDISALLVVAREIVKQYELFCFVHDKKEHKNDYMHSGIVEDTQLWIKNLWDNMLKSEEYIYNILDVFQNKNIGLLVPPAPIGKYRDEWYATEWGNNYQNTKRLAKELGLTCQVEIEQPAITLGSVFWCKTYALKKMLIKEWKYDDFPKEPLPLDGTISHAVERIIGYVAKDAGYDIGIVMCESYAKEMFSFAYIALNESFGLLKQEYGITKLYQIEKYEEEKAEINNFCKKYEDIYLYGAGKIGLYFLKTLRKWGYIPRGFIVSQGKRTVQFLENIPIYEIDEVVNKNAGIIITVRFDLQDILIDNLKKFGFRNYLKCSFNV